MKFSFFALLFLSLCLSSIEESRAQEKTPDTLRQLPTASVRAYLRTQPYLQLISSVGLIDKELLNLQQGTTLLPAFNTIPGVRMEERSPGSYRLSIRGSLLRSPFGVRNVKIYLDEVPLTDASGNTYLNSIDPSTLHNITILKGPDGSLFGANSGGVVIMTPNGLQSNPSTTWGIRESAGSYGLFHHHLTGNYVVNNKYNVGLDYAYQRSDGYRENTASHRHFIQTAQRFKYTEKNELRFIGLYSSMAYRTPGGLTEAQYAENPKQARPAAGPNPGATQQQAAIYNNTLLGGLIHDAFLTSHLKHVFSVFGSYTDFKNPFITNFEKRYEHNYGVRSYFSYTGQFHSNFTWQADAGIEWQQSKADILNFDNNGGVQGKEQAGDALKNYQHFYFVRFSGDLAKRLNIEAALSLNYYKYAYKGLFPETNDQYQIVDFKPTWMPRVAASYLITPAISWRASVGRGFSPPTAAEVRSSDKIINTALQPETGWNKETGVRWQSSSNRFQLDISVFSYRMQDAIVRLSNENGEEFFTNAGGVKQRGVEAAVSAWILQPDTHRFINGLRLSSNFTWSHFRFDDYRDNGNNYSGNKLTGVPGETVVSGMHILFPKKFSFYLQHNYTSSIPLNDANTAYAKRYHLVQSKLSWEKSIFGTTRLQLFAGIDNLLNENYSLGNDINAFGGRYYNAAMPRNYYMGLNVQL